jgi:integrase
LELDAEGNIKLDEELKALTFEEAKQFVRLIYRKGDRLAIGYMRSLLYGLRPGEVLGLKWSDISFEHKTIVINRDAAVVCDSYDIETLKATGYSMKEDDVKSKTSKRLVYISDEMVELLKDHQRIVKAEQEAAGSSYIDRGYVMVTKNGTITGQRNYARSFEKTMCRDYKDNTLSLGLKGKTPHNLRATFATMCDKMAKMNIKYIAMLLGHSAKRTVTDVYIDTSWDDVKAEFKEKAEYIVVGYQRIALEEIAKRDNLHKMAVLNGKKPQGSMRMYQ